MLYEGLKDGSLSGNLFNAAEFRLQVLALAEGGEVRVKNSYQIVLFGLLWLAPLPCALLVAGLGWFVRVEWALLAPGFAFYYYLLLVPLAAFAMLGRWLRSKPLRGSSIGGPLLRAAVAAIFPCGLLAAALLYDRLNPPSGFLRFGLTEILFGVGILGLVAVTVQAPLALLSLFAPPPPDPCSAPLEALAAAAPQHRPLEPVAGAGAPDGSLWLVVDVGTAFRLAHVQTDGSLDASVAACLDWSTDPLLLLYKGTLLYYEHLALETVRGWRMELPPRKEISFRYPKRAGKLRGVHVEQDGSLLAVEDDHRLVELVVDDKIAVGREIVDFAPLLERERLEIKQAWPTGDGWDLIEFSFYDGYNKSNLTHVFPSGESSSVEIPSIHSAIRLASGVIVISTDVHNDISLSAYNSHGPVVFPEIHDVRFMTPRIPDGLFVGGFDKKRKIPFLLALDGSGAPVAGFSSPFPP